VRAGIPRQLPGDTIERLAAKYGKNPTPMRMRVGSNDHVLPLEMPMSLMQQQQPQPQPRRTKHVAVGSKFDPCRPNSKLQRRPKPSSEDSISVPALAMAMDLPEGFTDIALAPAGAASVLALPFIAPPPGVLMPGSCTLDAPALRAVMPEPATSSKDARRALDADARAEARVIRGETLRRATQRGDPGVFPATMGALAQRFASPSKNQGLSAGGSSVAATTAADTYVSAPAPASPVTTAADRAMYRQGRRRNPLFACHNRRRTQPDLQRGPTGSTVLLDHHVPVRPEHIAAVRVQAQASSSSSGEQNHSGTNVSLRANTSAPASGLVALMQTDSKCLALHLPAMFGRVAATAEARRQYSSRPHYLTVMHGVQRAATAAAAAAAAAGESL
jgi:hypothetical protein